MRKDISPVLLPGTGRVPAQDSIDAYPQEHAENFQLFTGPGAGVFVELQCAERPQLLSDLACESGMSVATRPRILRVLGDCGMVQPNC